MNVTINGKPTLTNFDIFQAAGGQYIACDRDINVVSDNTGNIVIQFVAVKGSSCINGIEILSIPRFQTDVPLPAWAQGALAADGAGVTGAGPSAADMVNAGSGVYENNPGADIGVSNPFGPSPVFARMYRTKNAFNGNNSPGLPTGWTHNYDIRLYDAGATLPILPLSAANPQTIIVPPLPVSQQMRLLYPNGALERWTYYPPTGSTAVPLQTPTGAPYTVTGLPRIPSPGTPTWVWLKVTFKDRSQWLFTPYSTLPGYYHLTQIINVMGRAIRLNYDTTNRLSSITNDAATPATLLALNYNPQGYLQSIVEYTDPRNPRSVLYTCANGVSSGVPGDVVANDVCLLEVSQIAALNAARNARWKYAYQDLLDGPFMTAVSAPSPTAPNTYVTHSIGYDSNDFVKMLTDADNNSRAYAYLFNGSGANIQVKSAADGTVSQAWTQAANGFNLDAGSTDAANRQDMVVYGDPANPYSPTQTTNKNNQSAQLTYDHVGNVTFATATVNGNPLTTAYTYDYTQFHLGQLTSIKTGTKTPTTLHYNAAGLISQIDTPKPGTAGTLETVSATYTYTALGNVLTVSMPAPNDSGQPVQITYNYTSDPLDGITNWPEALGRPLMVTDPMGHVTHYRYDARGNVSAVITVVSGVRRQTDLTYNVADQPVQVMYPATTLGRKSMTTTYSYPGGPVTVTTLYDETGAMARQTTAVLGGEGQVKQQTGSAEHASFVLDGLSRLSQLKDGNGNAFQHVYDNLGNLQKLTYPGGGSNTATYDPEGNPLSSTDARSLTATYALAPDDSRVTGVTYSDNTPAVKYDYDEYGRVTGIADSTVTLTYAYDDLDNIIQATTFYADYAPANIDPFSLTYSYFPDGHRSSLYCPQMGGNLKHDYTYDLDGKLTQVQFSWGSLCTYTYDDGERLIRKRAPSSMTTFTYNALDQVTQQVNTTPAGALQSAYTNLTYDTAGNLTGYNDAYSVYAGNDLRGTRTFTYDNEDRLLSESSSRPNMVDSNLYPLRGYLNYTYGYAYDAADNFTLLRNRVVTNNTPASQFLTDGRRFTYGYDAEGNTTQTAQPGQDALRATYNIRGQLGVYQDIYGTLPAVPTWVYRPDGLLGSTQASANGFYPGRLYRIYDGNQLLFEHYCFPHGTNGFFSNGPDLGLHTLYGWGADGIVETFVEEDYAYGYYNASNYFYLAVLEQTVGYVCDPMGNVASHIYFGDQINLDYAFYDAFGLLLAYEGQALLPTSLWYKGQSGAETVWWGGANFGPMEPSNPLSWLLVSRSNRLF